MITVSTYANSTALTTLEGVKRLLQVESPATDDLYNDLIVAGSAAIESHCNRRFCREAVVETVKGYGGVNLLLSRAPIARVTSVIADGDVITDYVVENPGAGMLYRKRGWLDTVQLGWAISDYRVPGSEDPLYVVSYSAGYLLPGDNVEAEGEFFSVDGPNRTFTATGEASFPLTLVGGDRVYVTGFTETGNSGWLTVQSATASTLVVAETLTTEASTEGIKTFKFDNLPADIELAARETVKGIYLRRKVDDSVASKSIGDLSITYRQDSGSTLTASGVPVGVVARLAPYVRYA